ncbi:hypothetical protein BDN70DRAFT_893087 [Pholiota conissans]|uniref:Uncharacterized protein n=1 Tax=Pholiota conissans TaxID=109636 RepID=A0A9P6CVI1_9AGAR|nr:hypothetical protein BDN70DRAFT_893087 [Pholiota conissans]
MQGANEILKFVSADHAVPDFLNNCGHVGAVEHLEALHPETSNGVSPDYVCSPAIVPQSFNSSSHTLIFRCLATNSYCMRFSDPSKTVEDLNPETHTVYSVAGFSYTYDDLVVFAKRSNITWMDEFQILILLPRFKKYICKNDIPNFSRNVNPEQFVNFYDDLHSTAIVKPSFIIRLQRGFHTLSHRFKPNENDELIRQTSAEMFGFAGNPPFRTLKDPDGEELSPTLILWNIIVRLPLEWKQLPEWHDQAGDNTNN